MPRVVSPAIYGIAARVMQEKLGDVRFADHDGAGLSQSRSNGSIACSAAIGQVSEAGSCRCTGEIKRLLDGNGHTMKRSECLATGVRSVGEVSFLEGFFEPRHDDGIYSSVGFLDSLDSGSDNVAS